LDICLFFPFPFDPRRSCVILFLGGGEAQTPSCRREVAGLAPEGGWSMLFGGGMQERRTQSAHQGRSLAAMPVARPFLFAGGIFSSFKMKKNPG
jgi:hypothetical protein